MTRFDGIRRWMRRLSHDGGAIAVNAALAMVPLSGLALGVVDLNRATSVKRTLHDALDASALAAARSTAATDAQLQAIGSQALAANFIAPGATIAASEFKAVDGKVVASARATMPTFFAYPGTDGEFDVNADTEVMRSSNTIELALVLDNTGSMAGTKLSTLKTAAGNLIDTLAAAAARSVEVDPVKISLVPFSMTVRVGAGYQSSSWMDQTGAAPINNEIFSTAANRFTLLSQMGVAWAGCVESRQSPYDVQDTAPTTATPATLFTPFFAPDEPSLSGEGYVNSYLSDVTTSSQWKTRQGYVAKYNKAPKTGENGAGYQYGPNAGCELQPLVRLTTDWPALKTAITNMTAVGDTNIAMGLVWGWHTLSPNAPFADGVAYGTPKKQKIVILMTDGENTLTSANNNNGNAYAGVGYVWQGRLGITSGTSSQRRAAMDARLATLCTNMKAQGIIIYAVRVEVSNGSSTVLQNCASTTEKFYDVQSVSQLNAVFDGIAASIQNLRISK